MSTTSVSQSTIFPVRVIYAPSIWKDIYRGEYDWLDSNITSRRFPMNRTGTRKVELQLIHLKRAFGVDIKKLLARIDRLGYRPADFRELLALGAKYPEIGRSFGVIALGSICRMRNSSDVVPIICRYDSGRQLDLHWVGLDWIGDDRYAVVRK